MRFKFNIILFVVFASFLSHAQVYLKVRLFSQVKKPVAFAIIEYQDKKFPADENGAFTIPEYIKGSPVSVKKLGFSDTTLTIASVSADTLDLHVMLRSKIVFLDEVPVYSNLVREINPMKAGFIMDYELYHENIVELLSGDNVVLLSADNTVKCRTRAFPSASDLVKDPFNNLNLVTSDYAYKIKIDSALLKIDSVKIQLDKLNWFARYCNAITDTLFFITRYKDVNQTTAFFAISARNNKNFKLLKEISDEDKKRAVRDYARKANALAFQVKSTGQPDGGGVMGEIEINELELRRMSERYTNTLKMNYALPSYNALKYINDSIYLFAHDIDSMFVYTKNGSLIKGRLIQYHHLKLWSNELIVNEEKTKVYAKFLQDSKLLIAEVDLNSGQLKMPFFKVGVKYPKKIRISGNTIYFLSKSVDGTGYSVYSQNIQL